jgi:uncharacterized protein (DUF58 family)
MIDPAIWTQAERLAQALGSLRLNRLENRAGAHGRHRRHFAGSGSEFWDYRMLTAGEPIERIDWRRSARGDALFQKRYQEQTAWRLVVWPDPSASMQFQSPASTASKLAYAHLMCLALGLAAFAADENVEVHGPAGAKTAGGISGLRNNPASPFLELTRVSAPACVIIASDFLGKACPSEDQLHASSGRGLTGVFLHLIDPAEAAFPFDGDTQFTGLEGEPPVRISDPAAVRASYLQAFSAHQTRLQGVLACANRSRPG